MPIEARFRVSKGDFRLTIDHSINDSGITALFGPSGCGKTTLLRAIAGLDRPDQGHLVVDGHIWQDASVFLPPHRRPLGYVFQENRLFTHLTVQQNIEYGLKRVPPQDRRVALEEIIELMNIAHLLSRHPATLSGGEKQRVAISRALAVSPQWLLMDEPLAALDRAHKLEILPYIESLARSLSIPVLYVSHANDEVARLADDLILMEDGEVIGSGPIAELLTRLDLPLAQVEEAESIIQGTVVSHDDTYNLSQVDFSGGQFYVARVTHQAGDRVRLRILARDVSLTLQQQQNTSILNIFPARVAEIQQRSKSQVTVRLIIGDQPVLARVTRKSAALLDIVPGKSVFAQVKSVALLP